MSQSRADFERVARGMCWSGVEDGLRTIADALERAYSDGRRGAAEECAEIADRYKTNSGVAIRQSILTAFGIAETKAKRGGKGIKDAEI